MAAKKKPAPKRGASRYQAPAKKPIPGWLWMAIGLTVGAFIVFLMKLDPGQGDDVKRVKQEQQKATKMAEANKTAPSPTAPVKPKYDFYTLLPESEVIVPPDAVPEKTLPTPQVPTTPVTPAEAAKIDTARAQAALAGITPPPAPPVAETKAGAGDQVLPASGLVPETGGCGSCACADHSAGPDGDGGVRHGKGRDLVSRAGGAVQQPRTADRGAETIGRRRV